MALAAPVKIGSGTNKKGPGIRLDPRERTGDFSNNPPKGSLKTGGPRGSTVYTKKAPFPSSRPVKRAIMTRGGPAPQTNLGKPPKGGRPMHPLEPQNPMGMGVLRSKKMARRVGVLKTGIRGTKVVNRIKKARQNLRKVEGRRVIDVKGPKKIIKTKGRTVIKGPNRTVVVTKSGSVIRDKKHGNIIRATGVGSGRSKVVARYGALTKTKADDARAVKLRGKKRAFIKYTKGGRTVAMVRKAGTPRKVTVTRTGPKGTLKKVIGPKRTRITGPGGKTRVVKTRYVSQQRRQKVTARPNQPGYARGNYKPKKAAKKTPGKKTPGKKTPAKKRADMKQTWRAHSDWEKVRAIRRKRRKRGARFNQSLTKGQLKAVTSRSYS